MTYKNCKTYVNKGTICKFRKLCVCTYFAVPFDPSNFLNTEFAVFTDEYAAEIFAFTINSEIVTDKCFVYLY